MIADRYVVEGVLGQGGMGIVLAAIDRETQLDVALKVLLPGGAAIDGGKERFLREARAASALTGAHVALVIDSGTLPDGAPYMVMERLFGHDLRVEIYQRGRLPAAETAGLLAQVCEALTEAHARGIVHRDLKPANLFLAQQLDGSRTVKVLDFGLAKVVLGIDISPQGFTRTGVVVGSPPYMSPEQLRSLKLADARSDIWSLGVIAYEMVTGQRPFQGEQAAGLIASIIADTPDPPRRVQPDVPEALDALIMRCLQKDPAARPQTIAEVARELSALCAPPSVRHAAPVSAPALRIAPPPASAPRRDETGPFKTDDIQTGQLPIGYVATDHTDHIQTGHIQTDHIPTDHLATGDIQTGHIATGDIEIAGVAGTSGALAAALGPTSTLKAAAITAPPTSGRPVLPPSPAEMTMVLPEIVSQGALRAPSPVHAASAVQSPVLAAGAVQPRGQAASAARSPTVQPSPTTTALSMGSGEMVSPPSRATFSAQRRPLVLLAGLSVAALVIMTALLVGAGGSPSSGAASEAATSAQAVTQIAPAQDPALSSAEPSSQPQDPAGAQPTSPTAESPSNPGSVATSDPLPPTTAKALSPSAQEPSPTAGAATKPTGAPRPTSARPKRPGNTSDWR